MNNILHYNIYGTGKSLLLIHGWAMHAGVWADAVSEFSSQYQVITVDLRGHGASASMPGPFTFAAFAEDIRRLIEHLNLKNITAAGWSMGVSVLLKMLEAEAPHVDSLVFISGTPCFISREGYMHGVPEITVQRLFRQVARSYPSGLKNFHSLLFTPEEQSALQSNALFSALTDLHAAPVKDAALESLQCLQDEDLRAPLDNIHVPALLIHGDRDIVCRPDASRYMHERIGGSKILFLKDTGHAPFVTRQGSVHRAIKEFLGGL